LFGDWKGWKTVDMQAVEDRVKVTKVGEGMEQQGIREELVKTAVKFLENSKVQSSTEKMKKDFLIKKGLTEAEIEQAFSKVSQVTSLPSQQKMDIQYAPMQQQMVPQSSFSSRLRDLLNILLLIGGASYAARYLWKKYISPWLFGATKAVKTPHEMVLETTQAVLKTVEQLQRSVQSLQTSLDNHSSKLDMVTTQVKPEETGAMQDLKSEIQSVKGLLLSSFVSQSPSPLSTGGGSSLTRRSPLKNGIMSPSQLIFPFNLRNLTSFQSFQS